MEKQQAFDLLIFGASGHAKVVCDCAKEAYPHLAMISGGEVEGMWNHIPVLSEKSRSFAQWRELCSYAFVAIGNGKRREMVTASLEEAGFIIVTLVHPTAVVSAAARLEAGVLVGPVAVVNADAHVGKGCILNTGSIVEHECDIGAFAHLSPHATLGGGAVIGPQCWICMGAVVTNHVQVGAGTTVGAGAVVLSSLPENVMAAGIPAEVRKTYS